MTERRELWIGIALIGLTEALIGLPIYLLAPLLVHTPLSPLLWLTAVPFAVWAGLGLSFLLQGRMRLLHVIGFVLFAAGFGFGIGGAGKLGWVACVVFGAALYRGMLAIRTVQPDYRALWVALVGYAVAAVVYRQASPLAAGASFVRIGGLATLSLTLFLSNGITIRQATLPGAQRPKLAPGQLLANRVITAVLLGVILALSAFGGVSSFIRSRLYAFLVWFFHRFHGASGPTATPAPTPPRSSLPQGVKHPWAFWIFLEKLLYVAGYVAAVLFLLWALWHIARLLMKHGGALLRFLLRQQEGGGPGYTDEQTSLGTWSSRFAAMRSRLAKSTPREPHWEKLANNREKVRYLYRQTRRQLLLSGLRPDPAWTPRETGTQVKQTVSPSEAVDELIQSYEQVRYRDAEPSDQDVDRLRTALKPVFRSVTRPRK